ncbi:MAG: hypothetical protein H6744_01035 [Deltaproteobacteria bacterium]|nr:hypothetical protein [Deltaproteobacteria bacterium]MCB9785251.1 hypothetical protein [Deltaproteobacteria bacterium]
MNKTLGFLAALAAATAMAAAPAEATPRDEVMFLTLDGGVPIPVSHPVRDALDPGFVGGAGLYHTWAPAFAAGLRAHGGFFAGQGRHHDASGFGLFSVALRVRPFAARADVRRATGPWFEGGMGLGLLDVPGDGADARFTLEGATGWGFPLGRVGLSPFFRVMHFVDLHHDDVVAVVFGAEVNIFDRRIDRALALPGD